MIIKLEIETNDFVMLEEAKDTIETLMKRLNLISKNTAMPTYLRASQPSASPSAPLVDEEDTEPIPFAAKVKLKDMICSVSGCFQRVKTKGKCQKHYMEEYNANKKARKEVNK